MAEADRDRHLCFIQTSVVKPEPEPVKKLWLRIRLRAVAVWFRAAVVAK